MLGHTKSRRVDAPITVLLEDLVPQDHVSRHLAAKLDLDFAREWARELYAERGLPSIDPVVFCKLPLVMFFEGIRPERQLIETASLHLAHRWHCGCALDEALPDHSGLIRIRQRRGIDVFPCFFEQVANLCQDAGLVWGRELYVDATKVEANADLNSLVPRFYFEATTHTADLFADEADDAAPPTLSAQPLGIVQSPIAPESVPAASDSPWRLLEERRLDPHRAAAWGYDRTSACHVNTTDPDAIPMRTGARTTLSYHDHHVVDGWKTRVRFRRKLRPHVTGESTYGATENIVAVEDAAIRASVPMPNFDACTTFFGKGNSPTAPTTIPIGAPAASYRTFANTSTPNGCASIKRRPRPQCLPAQDAVHR